MLGPGRYLLGAVELLVLVGFAWLGAARVRQRLLPGLGGGAGCLASTVLALALLLWIAELLGTVSALKPLPYLIAVAIVGLGLRVGVHAPAAGDAPTGAPRAPGSGTSGPFLLATVISLVIAGIAIGHFLGGVKLRLGTGMTGFDSTWYHGPFAAGFFQTGSTIDLHFIAPQFLAWFYPANGEVVHAIGMLAFSRDLLSPLLNLGWLVGCLLACWCIGRPFRVAPWSMALGAIALSVPALADQAGEARNDIVGIFFLLAAIAIALNAAVAAGSTTLDPAAAPAGTEPSRARGLARLAGRAVNAPGEGPRSAGLGTGALLVVGLAVGLAAGTKLNFLLPAAVLVAGLTAVAPAGSRWRTLLCSGGMALAGGGYWYLRNLIHSGNPLPWIHHLGPVDLPAPEQALGGREAHSVLGYLTDGSVWSEWFLPGLHGGLWVIWPALVAAAAAGLVLTLTPRFRHKASTSPGSWAEKSSQAGLFGPSTSGVLAVAGLVGIAAAVAWAVSPTSASGPEGMPRGFESGLRYLAPALVLGLALLPTAPPLRAAAARLASLGPRFGERPVPRDGLRSGPQGGPERRSTVEEDRLPRRWVAAIVAVAVLVAVVVGYPVERHYLSNRYRDPTFTAPGLDAAFAWARDVSGARIGTTSTRQYPLFGTDLSNRVAYLGVDRAHGGFEAVGDCRRLRRLIDAGGYDYVVASRDRIEAGRPPYPPQAAWIAGPHAEVVLRKPPTVVFRITGPLDPKACP